MTQCIHELTFDWCALCTGRDDPTIPSPEPSHHEPTPLENQYPSSEKETP